MIDAYIICPKLRGFRKKIFSMQVKDNFEYPVIFIDEINDSSKNIECEEELLFKINNFLKDEKVMIILKGLLKDNDESIF